MRDDIRIRRVSVEFLRPGPAHNQLLSPYTQYLAVCNDAGAAVVTVPYEHRVFERRLKELRYETGDQNDRLSMLQEIGRDMGRILEAVPGFAGALANDYSSAGLVHVRLTLSAAELALLPFELAEVPVGSAGTAVSIQTRPPVSLTRHIRTVSSDGLVWPDEPRILFISGDPQDVPFAEHRDALAQAIERFRYPERDDRTIDADGAERFGELLTVLINPTLAALQRECEAHRYTHVHLLTHGDLDAQSHESYGLVLRDDAGAPDVVSGERFVSAITRVGHRPAVVTIASCDSGNVGSIIVPGASFAHAVHQSGIPLVVASQFPLSKDGSIPLTRRLYQGLLWGEHPLHVVQQARAELHARYNTTWHDWASVVVYEALPPTLDDQLDLLRYSQAKRAMNAALERIDLAVASDAPITVERLDSLDRDVSYAVDRLPLDGQFTVECIGLRASSQKRRAQAAAELVKRKASTNESAFVDECEWLDRAKLDYAQAVEGLLVNEARAVQRKATLHWVLVQRTSLAAVLHHDVDEGFWQAARVAAEPYCNHAETEQRAWAYASLAELWLLRLAKSRMSAKERTDCANAALGHADTLDQIYPGVDAFPIKSSRRQFERYADWWGSDRFAKLLKTRGVDRRGDWDGKNGLVATARQIVRRLQRPAQRPKKKLPPSAPSGPGDGGQAPTLGGPSADSRGAARRAAAPEGSSGTTARGSGEAFFTIEALPAGHGDALWIEYGADGLTHRLLIDCGTPATSKALLARADRVPQNERFLELFVLSHIDSDHIGGALAFFKAVKRGLRFGDIWFNGWRHISGQLGARQGEMFSTAIQDLELPWNVWRDGKTIVVDNESELPTHRLPGGMTLTLLSPRRAQLDKLKPIWVRELKRYGLEPGGRVDYSRFLRGTPSTRADAAALADIDALADAPFGGDSGAPNGTSIALLAEFRGARALLAADAHAPVLVESIKTLLRQSGDARLKVDLYKVSHHGSQNNVSADLVQLLDCPRYLVSTNGDHFFHPDRQAMARILKYGGDQKTVYFNYDNELNDVWGADVLTATRKKYGCSTVYPPTNQPGISVKLL
jgi:beta-lactamase superfamily II metal-dependent hydrolase